MAHRTDDAVAPGAGSTHDSAPSHDEPKGTSLWHGLEHGGDWEGYRSEFGSMPLDFSINISPLGIPAGARQAIMDALDAPQTYPDPLCRELRGALAKRFDIPTEHILCGNGASDLFERFARALRPKRCLLLAPTFSEYASSLKRVGCEIVLHHLSLDDELRVTERIFDDIDDSLDLVFICNPNNPTGHAVDREMMQRIADACRRAGALLAVDECFNEFLDDPTRASLVPAGCRQVPEGTIIFRAFTKSYAMAGIRLGYCLSADTQLLARMRDCGQQWCVSTVAQAAGIAALEDTAYLDELRNLIGSQRPKLAEQLRACGLKHVMGDVNFLLFYTHDEQLDAKMRQQGVLIRRCDNFEDLESGWFRVAVKLPEDNDRLIEAIKECM